MNEKLFLSATLENVSRVYSGKRDCCRCGCAGDYTDTSYNTAPNSYTDQNDRLVEKRLRRAQKLVASGTYVEYGETYVDIETGNDRTLTFYFDDVSNTLVK